MSPARLRLQLDECDRPIFQARHFSQHSEIRDGRLRCCCQRVCGGGAAVSVCVAAYGAAAREYVSIDQIDSTSVTASYMETDWTYSDCPASLPSKLLVVRIIACGTATRLLCSRHFN